MTKVDRSVVAALVVWSDRVLLTRRSALVDSDRGLWHCITGYLEPETPPFDQALHELEEELGLSAEAISEINQGDPISIASNGLTWQVHPYLIRTAQRQFQLNWENDALSWVHRDKLAQNTVAWLPLVGEALGYSLNSPATRPLNEINTKPTSPHFDARRFHTKRRGEGQCKPR